MNTDNEIKKEIQSKFNNYRAPVPADGWDRLEKALNEAARARMAVRRRWITGSAAAISILIIGSILFLPPSIDKAIPVMTEAGSSGNRSVQDTQSLSASGQDITEDVSASSAPTSTKNIFVGRRTARLKGKSGSVSPVSGLLTAWLERDEKDLLKVDGKKHDPQSVIQHLVQPEEVDRDGNMAEEFVQADGERGGLFAGYLPGDKEKEQIVLAVNGRGGLTPFQQTVNSPMTLRSATYAENNAPPTNSKMMLTGSNTADNISEMEHNQPVSFGITLSKSLFEDLSIETGFVYTYLSSRARNSSTNFQVQETQHLHYVGVPLNINYNLFSLRKMDVYASVGGMIEKDVYGEFRRRGEGKSLEMNISSEEEEVTKISQANPQLSVNAGMGISYPIYQKLNLYGKIGGAYYFDANNAYKTIYSDSKIVMDLSVGLRYEF